MASTFLLRGCILFSLTSYPRYSIFLFANTGKTYRLDRHIFPGADFGAMFEAFGRTVDPKCQ